MTLLKNLVIFLVSVLLCTQVFAQVSNYDRQLLARAPSTVDEVGVAFLKTASNFPDFSKVVQASKEYKNLDPLAQKDFLMKKTGKYQTAYLGFNPRKSDLIVRVKVNALFQKYPDGSGSLKIRTFDSTPVYFPFYFANYPIALIAKDIEMFKDIQLDDVETDIVYSRLSLSGDATMLLQLYPIAANDTVPMTLDNIPQYPLLSDIGYIGILNRRGEQIWSWKNPKYMKKTDAKGVASRDVIDLIPRTEIK